MPIGLVHDFRDGRDIGSSRSSDASFVHDQSLTAFLDEEPAGESGARRIENLRPERGFC
jgi:hypothetical protein